MKLNSKSINYNVQTVDELVSLDGLEGDTVVVTDENRGGVFVYREDNVGTNNGGTIFNGWTRQYDGAVNVKWFGAKGDGVTDNTVAINKALESSENIYIPEGVYYTGALSVSKNVLKMYGTGFLQLKQGVIDVLLTINDFSTCIIEGITFIGNRENTTPTDPSLRKRLLQLTSTDGFGIVKDCVFTQGNYGGFSIDSAYSKLENNYVYACGYTDGCGDGISVVSFLPNETVILNNKVIDAADYGIAIDAINVRVENNYVEGARSAGIGSLARYYSGKYLGSNFVILNNSLISCVKPFNFFSGDSDSSSGFVGLTIANNYIENGTTDNAAIFITRNGTAYTTAGHNIKILNNYIKGTTISQGIAVIGRSTSTGTTYDILIDGNTIDTEKPIILEGCSDYIITNNICSYQGIGYGTRGIRLTNCYGGSVSNNIIRQQDIGILVNNSDVNLYGNDYINIQSKGLLINTGIVDIREHFKNIGQRPLLIDSPTLGDYRSIITGAVTFTNCSSVNTGTPVVLDIYDPGSHSHDIRFDYIHNYPDHTTGFYALCPFVRNPTSSNQRIEITDAIGCKLDAEVAGSNLKKGATTPSIKYWRAGTKTIITEPTAGSYIGAVCTVSGTPGTWKTFGAITA